MEKINEFRAELFDIARSLLTKAYAKEGHTTWKYAFVKKCKEIYEEKIQYITLTQMESGEKNITSKMYVLLFLEIERNYGIEVLKKLQELDGKEC